MDEHKLVIGLISGDKEAFRKLYEMYAPRLAGFCRKYLYGSDEAAEVVQEVFLTLWEKRENIDANRSFSAYVIQAAKNRLLNNLRKKVNEQAYLDYLMNSSTGKAPMTTEDMAYIELKNKAENAIKSMPSKRQEIFRLSREGGLKNREIAEKLNLSIKTVENQMGQALKYLREELHEYRMMILLFLLLQI